MWTINIQFNICFIYFQNINYVDVVKRRGKNRPCKSEEKASASLTEKKKKWKRVGCL